MDCQLDKFVCDCCGLFLLMVNLESKVKKVKKKIDDGTYLEWVSHEL